MWRITLKNIWKGIKNDEEITQSKKNNIQIINKICLEFNILRSPTEIFAMKDSILQVVLWTSLHLDLIRKKKKLFKLKTNPWKSLKDKEEK